MMFGVSPYGSNLWWYYRGSRMQYDKLQRFVKLRKASQFAFEDLDDITEEMLKLGQPREAQIDDPLFDKMKSMAENSLGRGQTLEERFSRLVSMAFYMVELMKDGKRKDKWEAIQTEKLEAEG